MAIPISEYIDIKSKVLQGAVTGSRDFSGLVFTKDAMKTTVPSQYSAIKTAYDAGTVVDMTADMIADCFANTAKIYNFAPKYFGYNGGNSSPAILHVVKVTTNDTNAKAAYTRVCTTNGFTNFGACTFIGTSSDFPIGTSSSGDLAETAAINEGTGHLFVVRSSSGTSATSAASALNGLEMTQLVISDADDYAAWMTIAWYASVDYNKDNASDTQDYKQFGNEPATVTTAAMKETLDAVHANYIGLVQVNGRELKFFQQGVNMNGVDTGTMRDKTWLEGEIAAGWFNLATTQKIPANYAGVALVRTMVVTVASRAVDNGVILLDKPLDDSQIARIYALTQDDGAADAVSSSGYYVDAKIIQDGDRYVCEYTLVYAKGDHIGKVSGTNYLV